VLLPAVAGAAWIGLVAAMSELGYSGEERYAMPGVALVAVAAGCGVAWAAARVPVPAWAAASVLVLLAAGQSAGGLADDARDLHHEARLYGALDDAVDAAGGRVAVLRCAPVHTAPYSRPALAWRLHVPIGALSTETARGGTAFRARPYRAARPGPALAPEPGFRPVAGAGPWAVMARC
jgi:hypothetical protein